VRPGLRYRAPMQAPGSFASARGWLGLSAVVVFACGPSVTVDAPRTDPTASAPASSAATFSFGPLEGLPVVATLRSGHPAGDFRAEVLASPGFAYGRAGRAAPAEGDLVVERLRPEGSDGVTLTYVMRREPPGYFPSGGDFRYGVLGPRGEVLAEGKLPLCARCHAEAPRDFLFERGIPTLVAPR
jgi:hypothetical protein